MLYRKLYDYASRYANFAYTCKFDRQSRENGSEKLFLSSAEPHLAYSGIEEFIREAEKASIKHEGELPLYIGYEAVSELYGLSDIKRSKWPAGAYIDPDDVLHGSVRRNDFEPARDRNLQNVQDEGLQAKIKEAKERIISGELLQIVLSKRFEVSDIDPFALLQHFVENDRSLFVFYFRFGEFEIIGSSPENIVTREGRDLEVHPIAGTTPRGKSDQEDSALAERMITDRKELREHRMLVDLARNDLGVVSVPGSVKVVKSMEIQKFASVQHIVSTVRSTLRDGKTNFEIIKSLFPAGTVSGAPKIRAMKLINHYEESARGPYAGGVGLISAENLELALNIRSIFRSGKETYTQAGAGIVMDSDPAKEVREIHSKAETVMGGIRNENLDY